MYSTNPAQTNHPAADQERRRQDHRNLRNPEFIAGAIQGASGDSGERPEHDVAEQSTGMIERLTAKGRMLSGERDESTAHRRAMRTADNARNENQNE